jgi:hypothetical protein
VARKFLYIIAGVIVVILIGLMILQSWGLELTKFAFVPKRKFEAVAAQAPNAYATNANLWYAKPNKDTALVTWRPKGAAPAPAAKGNAAIFFIHPTSHLDSSTWNAALNDAEATDRAKIFIKGQASVFADAGDVWAPRYRQATFGAFLTDQAEGRMAIDAAYRDVALAFDQFVKEAGNRPIILAGHSQGANHLSRLLAEKVARQPIVKRIIAAYVIGWPVSMTADLPALGMPACSSAAQRGCILSWASYAEPADTRMVEEVFDVTKGLAGQPRRGSTMLCTNPLTGTTGGAALATANLGTLKNKADFSDGELIAKSVPARCGRRGFLMIGAGPDLGNYVLPGGNYHVYDFSLFWANTRVDALRRLVAK